MRDEEDAAVSGDCGRGKGSVGCRWRLWTRGKAAVAAGEDLLCARWLPAREERRRRRDRRRLPLNPKSESPCDKTVRRRRKQFDPDAFARLMTVHYKRRREQASAPEDRLTSLHDDLLNSILAFLPIKQRVALSAVCSRFRSLLPFIPRLEAFRLDVGLPSGGVYANQQFTFPRALIHQCRVVFGDEDDDDYLPEPLEQLLFDDLARAGLQDLILENSTGKGWLYLSGRDCGLIGIKSLRSLSLVFIRVMKYFDRHPLSPLGCPLLTSLKMERCLLRPDFLCNLFASCPFLETLQLIFCIWFLHGMGRLSIHSASIKHLVLLELLGCVDAIDISGPMLESLIVEVVDELHIEAPRVQNASFLLALHPPADPPVALMNFLGADFRKETAWLMLNSSKTTNRSAAENGIDEFIYPGYKEDAVIFNLNFNLKNCSSTMILSQLLKKCKDSIILADSTHIENTNEDDCLLHGSTEIELIDLQMRMPKKIFEGFLLNQKEMTEELEEMGLQMLRSRTSTNQVKDVLASEESLFQVSSSIANCIEMKF
ncbi:uncharacterized protein LOC122048845 [Zingiber officinale]|uniref:uncharacterized protein LOC122048845 n=1 Tax=Zingiber officinale TaxID=94328 RepID=UPI001C4BAF08|nr:uncharacterized protein LOC122048845 [Zingiber officinale]